MNAPFVSLAPVFPVRATFDVERRRNIIAGWLALVFALVTAMVALGGATRLTGSGLSMVEWRPLMGLLPPTSDEQWAHLFHLYQQSPQFRTVNQWMDLAAFQQIFWLEYLHRLLGRVIGLFVAVPWLFFLARGWMDRRLATRTGLLLVLGGAQGALGWFMVASGLVGAGEVSHLRLAAHLLLAFFVAMWLVWIFLDLVGARLGLGPSAGPAISRMAWALAGLVVLQCIYGAFMAGTHAGLLFSSFPDLNGTFSPRPFFDRDHLLRDLVHNPAAIHWVHRLLAWVTVAFVTLTARSVLIRRPGWGLRSTAWAMLVIVAIQFGLGVATVVLHVPVAIAVAHQLGGLAMLTAVVTLAWQVHPRRADRVTPTRSVP